MHVKTYSNLKTMQLQIQTKEEPLVINDLYGIFTGYPFKMNAQFDAGNDTLNKILETGWRTARSWFQTKQNI